MKPLNFFSEENFKYVKENIREVYFITSYQKIKIVIK